MNIFVLSALSISLYTIGAVHQALIQLKKLGNLPFISFLIGFCAAALQLTASFFQLSLDDQYNFSLFNSASLIAGIVVIGLTLISIKRSLYNAAIPLYLVAIGTLACSLAWGESSSAMIPENSGIITHITLSIIAYSVLSIAAIQAILIHAQNNNLKKKNSAILLRNLPPLLAMEKLLFEMLWSGTILLTCAILAGLFFVDNLFAQHLAHKTFFSILSLGIFSTLLAGRVRYGWRGLTASTLTLWGVVLLMLGFFGSKFALEWLIT